MSLSQFWLSVMSCYAEKGFCLFPLKQTEWQEQRKRNGLIDRVSYSACTFTSSNNGFGERFFNHHKI